MCFCNSVEDADFPSLERQLLAEISRVDREIAALRREHETLSGMLFRARKRELGNRQVTRTNSLRRVMIENAILTHLSRVPAGRAVASGQLFIEAQRAVPGVGRSTFASHLHRLKQKGLVTASDYGAWLATAEGREAATVVIDSVANLRP